MHGHCTVMRNSLCRNPKCTYKVASAAFVWSCDQHMTLKIQITRPQSVWCMAQPDNEGTFIVKHCSSGAFLALGVLL